jgi:hypothetical protein
MTGVLASASGSSSLTATVDFQDGKGPVAAVLTRSQLGGYQISAPHTFSAAGSYSVLIAAKDGTQTASTAVTVAVSRTAPSLISAYDSVCLASDGQGGSCDGEGNAFSTPSLASHGFVQGTTVKVPGTALSFDLPSATAVPAGRPDNATGNGQVIPLALGADVTQLSVIGTANEHAQDTVGTLTYSDGSTSQLPIQFGDWTASVKAPQFGNILVAQSDGRYSGGSLGDSTVAGIFSTAPVTLPTGKRAVSLTLPIQTGGITATGRIHVFAVATDGTRLSSTPITVASSPLTGVGAGAAFTGQVGTVSGGSPTTPGAYTATVNWGDGTATTTGTVDATSGAITGSHTYAKSGTYTVTVVADDGVGSAAASSQVVLWTL